MIRPLTKDPRAGRVAALFAGIGGIELGLHRSGFRTAVFCEIDPGARRVLHKHFPGVRHVTDVRAMKRLPRVEVVTAGFPCQDLSQAGCTRGIGGSKSGLVAEVFRLLEDSRGPKWLLLENVPFMLQLEHGKAMLYLTEQLERLGFSWAYRVVDTRAFGLPQRRQRVLLLASREEDPRGPLLGEDAGPPSPREDLNGVACGFYWTEGLRGLGWAVDAVPTLKAGSTVGIPSPPAIWLPGNSIVTPDVRDAERLQGFPADWTKPAEAGGGGRNPIGRRWRLVGNAVSVPLSEWLGRRLRSCESYDASHDRELGWQEPWPEAAWGMRGLVCSAGVSKWPVRHAAEPLMEFLRFPLRALSERAACGFLGRAERSGLRFSNGFLDDVRSHAARMALQESGR